MLLAALAWTVACGLTIAQAPAPRVAVLAYHELSPNPRTPYTITPDRLEDDLRWFLDNGWHPLTLEEFREWMAGRRALMADSFLVTFDDGYASLAEYALPVLERLRVPAVAYVITGKLDAGDPGPGLPKLSPGQVTALARSGMVSFGSHTHNLHRETGPPGDRRPAVDASSPAELAADLSVSGAELQRLTGVVPVALAWPYGRAPAWALAVAQERFPLVFTGDEGLVRPERPQAIPRFAMEWRTRAHLESQFARPGLRQEVRDARGG